MDKTSWDGSVSSTSRVEMAAQGEKGSRPSGYRSFLAFAKYFSHLLSFAAIVSFNPIRRCSILSDTFFGENASRNFSQSTFHCLFTKDPFSTVRSFKHRSSMKHVNQRVVFDNTFHRRKFLFERRSAHLMLFTWNQF